MNKKPAKLPPLRSSHVLASRRGPVATGVMFAAGSVLVVVLLVAAYYAVLFALGDVMPLVFGFVMEHIDPLLSAFGVAPAAMDDARMVAACIAGALLAYGLICVMLVVTIFLISRAAGRLRAPAKTPGVSHVAMVRQPEAAVWRNQEALNNKRVDRERQ